MLELHSLAIIRTNSCLNLGTLLSRPPRETFRLGPHAAGDSALWDDNSRPAKVTYILH